MLKRAVAVVAASLFSLPVLAAGDVYGGVMLSEVTHDYNNGSADPVAVVGRLGKTISQNVAIEGRLGFGLEDDRGVDVGHLLGGYVKGSLPVNRSVAFYGILGLTNLKTTYKCNGCSSDTETDLSYGLGVDFALDSKMGINLEWAHLVDGPGYDAEALSLGLTFKF